MRNGLVFFTKNLRIQLHMNMTAKVIPVENEHEFVIGNFVFMDDKCLDEKGEPSLYRNTWCFQPTGFVQFDGSDLAQLLEIHAFLSPKK